MDIHRGKSMECNDGYRRANLRVTCTLHIISGRTTKYLRPWLKVRVGSGEGGAAPALSSAPVIRDGIRERGKRWKGAPPAFSNYFKHCLRQTLYLSLFSPVLNSTDARSLRSTVAAELLGPAPAKGVYGWRSRCHGSHSKPLAQDFYAFKTFWNLFFVNNYIIM